MKPLFTALLAIHIAAGFLSLATGFVIAASAKGTRRHRRLGRIFYYAMLVITTTALALALMHPNTFLLAIAAFSLFQALGGRRVINNNGEGRSAADYLILCAGIAVSAWMLFSANGLLIFFGVLSAAATARFALYCFSRRYAGAQGRGKRLQVHIGMMGGSFIATLTAFVVVNVPQAWYVFVPEWLPWIIPTLAFLPVMVSWSRTHVPVKEHRSSGAADLPQRS